MKRKKLTDAQFYSKHISKQIMRLAEKCSKRGMSFIASIEYGPNETGETTFLGPNAGLNARIGYMGVKCHGNVDALIIGLKKYARDYGHSSIFMQWEGIPLKPTSNNPEAK